MNQQVLKQTSLTEANPFYKYGASLTLLQQGSKMTDNPSKSVINDLLTKAWKECKETSKSRKMFWSVVFSLGDITNRNHNIFRKKKIKDVDQGGNSLRKVFLYCIEWMSKNTPDQFYSFLPILGEYYNLGAVTMFNIIWTDRWKGTVKEHYRINIDKERLTTFIAKRLGSTHTPEVELELWARWLWRVPEKSRVRKFVVTEKGQGSVSKKYGVQYKAGDTVTGVRAKQKETVEKDKEVLELIDLLSQKMGWEIKVYRYNTQYIGYKNFRKKYLAKTEAHLFATQEIRNYDEPTFRDWLDTLPSGARFNVQRRLFNKKDGKTVSTGKWTNFQGKDLAKMYQNWLDAKEVAQQNLRDITPAEMEMLKKEDPNALKQIKKAAKVNTGGETLLDNIAKLFAGGDRQSLEVVCQSIMDKIKIEVPVLVTMDVSGSMGSRSVTHKGVQFSANQMSVLAATVFLLKNPDPELKDMFVKFHSSASVVAKGQITDKISIGNRYMNSSSTTVDWVTDTTKPFLDNFVNVGSLIPTPGGSTDFSSVAKELKKWVDSEPMYSSQRIDQIMKYQVILAISDGDFNGCGSPERTLSEFRQNMLQWFGWSGIVVVWDVKQQTDEKSKFDGMENVMYYGGCNPGILNQIFCNISDYQIIDIYTPLESLYKSNRYEPVRELVS